MDAEGTGVDGAVARGWRRSRGWDVPEMARRLRGAADGSALPEPVRLKRMMNRWEAEGLRTERYVLLYAAALGVSPEELADGPVKDPISSPQPGAEAEDGEDRVKRREFGIAALGVLASVPAASGAARSGSRPVPAVRRGDYVAPELARYFAGQLDGHYQADRHLGPGRLIPMAVPQYELLRELAGAAPDGLRGQLWAVAAGYAGLLGWLWQDAGDLGESGRWHDAMLEHAHRAADVQLVAFALYCKALMLGDEGDGPGVLDLTGVALARATVLIPKVRVLLLMQSAHGHALAGGDGAAAACARLVDEAGALLDAVDDNYEWGVACRTPRYLDGQRATVFTRLGDRAAVGMWEQVIPDIPASSGRDLGVFRARYAQALAGAGEPEQAVAVGAEVVSLAEFTGSARMRAELDVLCQRMEPWRGERAWEDLREALAPLRRGGRED